MAGGFGAEMICGACRGSGTIFREAGFNGCALPAGTEVSDAPAAEPLPTAGGVKEEAGGAAAAFAGPAAAATVGRCGGAPECVLPCVSRSSFCCWIARNTSPGREILDRSIFGFCSLTAGFPAALDGALPPRLRAARTRTASSSSTELECVFFSVTPTSGSRSRITLLLTSSSRARSLIRTLLIRLFRLFPNS